MEYQKLNTKKIRKKVKCKGKEGQRLDGTNRKQDSRQPQNTDHYTKCKWSKHCNEKT